MSKVKAITLAQVPLTAKRHERILGWVNRNRKSRGLKPIKQLRRGEYPLPKACPLGRSVNGAVFFAANGRTIFYPSENPNKEVQFPKFIHEFHEEMRKAYCGW